MSCTSRCRSTGTIGCDDSTRRRCTPWCAVGALPLSASPTSRAASSSGWLAQDPPHTWCTTVCIRVGSMFPDVLTRARRRGHTSVSYTHLRAHETPEHLVCRLLLEK